jgi:hypothetical protein
MTLSCYYLEIPKECKSDSPHFASKKESFLSAEKWAYIINICNQKPRLKSMTKLMPQLSLIMSSKCPTTVPFQPSHRLWHRKSAQTSKNTYKESSFVVLRSEISPNKFTQQQEIDSCRTLSVGVARHLE